MSRQSGVEGELGWFRRNRRSPMPVVESLGVLNDQIWAWEDHDASRRITDTSPSARTAEQ